jgi:hypothetical protein
MFVWFGPDGSKSAGTEEVAPAIMLDFDEHGHGVGIEVLDVAERLTRPQAAAEQISPEGAADFAPIFEGMFRARDDLERDLAVAGDGLGDRGSTADPERNKPGRDLGYTRYDIMAQGLGCYGEYVEQPEDIRPALERAQKKVDEGMVALVNVKTDYRARATTVQFSSRMT